MKNKSILFTLVALLFGLFSVNYVHASDSVSITGNTAGDAVITDKVGNTVSHTEELSQWTPYTVNYHMVINSENVSDGDNIYVYLPTNVQVKQKIHDVPVYFSKNTVVGIFNIDAGSSRGTITITNAKVINETPLKRELNLSFGVYGTRSDNTPSSDWIVNKVAWINSSNHNIIWNVAVNNVDGATNKVVIHDMPDSNSKLVSDNVDVQYGHYDDKGVFIVEKEGTLPINKTSDGFTVDLGNYSYKNAQITYETKPIKQGFVENKVELIVNGEVKGANQATVDYTANGDYTGSSEHTSSQQSSSTSNESTSMPCASSHYGSSSSHIHVDTSSVSSDSRSSVITSSKQGVQSHSSLASSNNSSLVGVVSSSHISNSSSSKSTGNTNSVYKSKKTQLTIHSNNKDTSSRKVSMNNNSVLSSKANSVTNNKSNTKTASNYSYNKTHSLPLLGEHKSHHLYLMLGCLIIIVFVLIICILINVK